MRYGLVIANIALLIGVISFVANTPASGQPVTKSSLLAPSESIVTNPLDQLSSADIAVHIAKSASLEEGTAVVNTADSYKAKLAITADDQVVSKPQVIATALPSRKDIKHYKTVEGDTISSIATKFGVTSDSIRFSNGINGDRVDVNKTLIIPPVNGIVYVVKAGDTPDSLASKYRANKDYIVTINDAEINGLIVGSEIVIPDALQPVTRTLGVGSYNVGSILPTYGSNGYVYGYCTWYVKNRRPDLPSNLGNANTWYSIAKSMGLPTGTVPRGGAVLWDPNTGSGLGHVGYVERVNDDGSIYVSDMNYVRWGVVSYRTIAADQISKYRFIY